MKWLWIPAAAAVVSAACATGDRATSRPKNPVDPNGSPGYDGAGDDPAPDGPRPPDYVNEDSGAFGAIGDRPNDAGRPNDGGRPDDPGDGAPRDAEVASDASTALCPTPLGAGDLAVVELMIASASGSGDRGEWVEVQNTRDCAIDVKGLRASSPRGTLLDTMTIGGSLVVAPGGILVIADSAVAAENHDLPGPLLVWDGAPADVLKNDGDTITLKNAAGVTIDELVYPKLAIEAGRAVSFPADCAWSDRADWARWSLASHVYAGALAGTPNAENTDVACF